MFYLTVLLLLSCLLDSDVLFLEIKQFIFADSRYVGGFNEDFHKIRHRFANIIVFVCAMFVLSVFNTVAGGIQPERLNAEDFSPSARGRGWSVSATPGTIAPKEKRLEDAKIAVEEADIRVLRIK